jgi:predicted Zn-dependent protease
MKNLNSVLAFALMVLAVAGCSSSNSNSNSSSGNNSNSSNSNQPANTSSSADKEKGVFHDDKAGIRLQAPDGWTTKLNNEQLTMSPPDDSMKIITWVPEGDFQKAIKDLDRKLAERIQRMKTNNKDGSESLINGMPTYTIAGTGQIDAEDIEWSVDIIKAPKKPVIVLSFAKPGAWEKHQDDIKQLVASIKPTS